MIFPMSIPGMYLNHAMVTEENFQPGTGNPSRKILNECIHLITQQVTVYILSTGFQN
jgi:hypothetical protein